MPPGTALGSPPTNLLTNDREGLVDLIRHVKANARQHHRVMVKETDVSPGLTYKDSGMQR
jgi:hypothetical protein